MRSALALSAAAALQVLSGCRSSRTEPPQVQPSSPAPRDTDVRITAALAYLPSCVVIRAGQTVEWWVDPKALGVPVNVTSLGSPVELFSPTLAAPLACDPAEPARVCWRHTFVQGGCFEYYDTNSGSAGRPVIDDYYGTVTFTGDASGVTRALVCVESDAVSCAGVCCNSNLDCTDGHVCKAGRCVKSTDGAPSPCPAPR